MKNSLGGIYSLGVVMAFIIIMSGFLAFTVNYNKAFKMKNKIITILEKYDNDINNESVQTEIREYAQSIGYSASTNYTRGCNGVEYTRDPNNTGWCYKVNSFDSKAGTVKEATTKYVDIETFVSIDVPILNRVFPNIRFFTVRGSTKQIRKIN